MKTRTLLPLLLLLISHTAFAGGDGTEKTTPARSTTCAPDAMVQMPTGTRCPRKEVAPFVDPTADLGDWVAELQRKGAGD